MIMKASDYMMAAAIMICGCALVWFAAMLG